jgi:hypothetical protein
MSRLRGESHPMAKLNNIQVLEIRKLLRQGFSRKLIARNFKVSLWNINSIAEFKTWNHLQ